MTPPEGESKVVLLVRLLNAIDRGRCTFEDLKDRIGESGKRPSTRSLRRYLAILPGTPDSHGAAVQIQRE